MLAAILPRTKGTSLAILNDKPFWDSLRAYAVGEMEPVFAAVYLGGVEIGLRMIQMAQRKRGKALRFKADLPDRLTRRAEVEAARLTDEWWTKMETTTRSVLADTLTKAADHQLQPTEVMDVLEPLFGATRARRIAVYETNRIVGAAAQDTYGELGVQKWDWRTAADGRVDAVCHNRAENGPYSMDEAFSPAHIGCRCWPVPHIEEGDDVADTLPPDAPGTAGQPESLQDQLLQRESPPAFKTAAQADAWLTDRHPSVVWDLKKVHPDLLAPVARQMDRLLLNYPGVAARLKYVGSYGTQKASIVNLTRKKWTNQNEIAHAARDGSRIGLNPKWYGDPAAMEAMMRVNSARGWFRPSLPGYAYTDHTITHEFGHLVDSWLRSEGGDLGEAYIRYRAKHIDRPHFQAYRFSGYAKESDFEHFAEMYATWNVADRASAASAWPEFARFSQLMEIVHPINAGRWTYQEQVDMIYALTAEDVTYPNP